MGELVTVQQKANTIRAYIEERASQLQMALPKHLSREKIVRTLMTEMTKNPALFECTPSSVFGALIEAAQLGLEFGVIGHAYVIPFRDKGTPKAQLIPGYKGLLKLARNSGSLVSVEAHAVYERDAFDFAYGLEPSLVHKPAWREVNRGEIVAFYAVARLKDGGVQVEVMSRAEVDAVKNRSRSANHGPWVTDYAEMGKKTVLRRLCKLLPASVELARAVALDEMDEASVDQALDVTYEVVADEPAQKTEEPKQ